jgi:acetyl esterase
MTTLIDRYPGLDPDFARVLAARPVGAPGIADLTPEQARAGVRAGIVHCAPGPQVESVVDSPGLRRYRPAEARPDLVLVWFHGGGWMVGDLDYLDPFCRLLADRLRCEVRSVDYRLAPEHPFPAAVDDAEAAVREAGRGASVLVAGDSAGGNLAAVVAQRLRGEVDIRGQLLIYPVVDGDLDRPSYRTNVGLVLGVAEMDHLFHTYAPRDRDSPAVSPLRATDLAGLPPAVVVAAGHDPLHDEDVAYAEALRAAGVDVRLLEYPSLVHGFLRYTAVVPAAAKATEEILAVFSSGSQY